MPFPRKPANNQLFADSQGDIWEYTPAFGWLPRARKAPKFTRPEKKKKIRPVFQNGLSKK